MLNKLLVSLAFVLAHAAAVAAPAPGLDNATCLTCHDGQKGKLEVMGVDGEKRKLRDVHSDKYGKSVHARMECVACHTDITDNVSPHKKSGAKAADCATLPPDPVGQGEASRHDGETAATGNRGQKYRGLQAVLPRPSRQGQPDTAQGHLHPVPRHPRLQRPDRQAELAIRRLAQGDSQPLRRVMPRRPARSLRRVGAWQGNHGQGQRQGARLHQLPHQSRDHQHLAGLVQAAQQRSVRRLPQGKPQVLPRYLSRPGDQARLCRNGEVLRLPRQPQGAGAERSQVEGAPGQPPEDLPALPRRQEEAAGHRGLRVLRPPRQQPRFRQISADVDRDEIHDRAADRRIRLLLVAFRPVVLPRMAGTQGTQGRAARTYRCAAAGSQALPALPGHAGASPTWPSPWPP